MSKEMREFLAAYLAWAESGAPEAAAYNRSMGLCSNVYNFGGKRVADALDEELSGMFERDGLDKDYPFGGEGVYLSDGERGTQHLNKQRLAWIREQLNRPE